MKDRIVPCMFYIAANHPCQKNIQDVTLTKCKNCSKYRPRKTGKRPEPVAVKRRKDKDRHDNWRKEI